MKKNYFFLAAASAMLLASCSNEAEAPKAPEDQANDDVLTLTTLTPSSQASRIHEVATTRGEKSERLELQYTIDPVNESSSNIWSVTGIAFGNNGVYVSWHSDRQASDPAFKWGGALDVIAYNAGGVPTFSTTYISDEAKFNSVISANNAFYLALTDRMKGGAVARVKYGETTAIVRQLHGSSANSLSFRDGRIYAATGYENGGIFSISADFVGANEGKAHVDTIVKKTGCKFIAGDYVLRTDADAAYIVSLDGSEEWNIGAPLKSEEKLAEKFHNDGIKDVWQTVDGTSATYYGKHTMAVDGDYIYVAGGKAEKGSKDGLRVYNKDTKEQVWGNATNTTAVCVSGDYVYAATGAGLRVYKKFDGKNLELYAFETTPEVDNDGNVITDEEGNVNYVAGTDGHSCNFVAVEGEYIYVAYGQTGVRVFKLNHNAPANEETPEE